MVRSGSAAATNNGDPEFCYETFDIIRHFFRLQLVAGFAIFRNRLPGIGHDGYGVTADSTQFFHRFLHQLRAGIAVDAKGRNSHALHSNIGRMNIGIKNLHFGKIIHRDLGDNGKLFTGFLESFVGSDQ